LRALVGEQGLISRVIREETILTLNTFGIFARVVNLSIPGGSEYPLDPVPVGLQGSASMHPMKAGALAYGGLIGASAGAISAVSLGIGATGLSLAGVFAIAAAGWVALASFPVVALVYKGK